MADSNSPPFHMKELDDSQSYNLAPPESKSLPSSSSTDQPEAASQPMIVDVGNIDSLPRLNYTQWKSSGRGLNSIVRMTEDGRLAVSLDLKEKLPDLTDKHAVEVVEDAVDPKNWRKAPPMQIVVFLVGSRGDIQPYIALGKLLQADGHRVRIATHENFKEFVIEHGLEFFCIGGNPHDLMSYMVKNPGLIPGMESLRNGDISRKRKMLREMVNGCWLSCHSADSTTGASFAADVIISNPPAFAHIHCAEALGIPLLMSFTMPWCSTTSFSHPLVNISDSNAGAGLTNVLSFALADILTWQGTGDLINKFRTKTLGLPPLDLRSGPGVLERCKVPWTYCMSPGLVPKPKDWKSHIDVVGFYFLDLATNYTPPDDLAAFLAAGEPPIYIGFGSVVIEDPEAMTKTIFEATEKAGVRALVSAGWGGLGGMTIPSHIFILGNVPHDWLFSNNRVKAVVHHGGAGTTAAGLAHGRPTAVVPFFGDQLFWGQMIHRAGAGPEPIPHKKLDAESLAKAIEVLISPSAQTAAQHLAEQIHAEDGAKKGLQSLYRHLPLLNMRCDLDEKRTAVWWDAEHCLKLSAFSAQVLVDAKKLTLGKLDAHRPREYDTRRKVTDPITGGGNAIFWTVTHFYGSIGKIFTSPVDGIYGSTVAIPKGVMKIVTGVQEGFHNAPKLYGSEVREKRRPKDLSSGIVEAGKSVFYGYYDGITGLYKEPIAGAKKEGFVGLIKGMGRSYVNATFKPAAGILGAVVLPFEGAWKQGQSMVAREQQEDHQRTRQTQGVEDVKKASATEKKAVLQAFEKAKSKESIEGRKTILRERAKLAMERGRAKEDDEEEELESEAGTIVPLSRTSTRVTAVESIPEVKPSAPTADVRSGTPGPPATTSNATVPSPSAGSGPSSNQSSPTHAPAQADSDIDWDDVLERDLARAHELSLATPDPSHVDDDDDEDFKKALEASKADVGGPATHDSEEEFQKDLDKVKELSLVDQ